jgi:outer membrane cobalamin receptor
MDCRGAVALSTVALVLCLVAAPQVGAREEGPAGDGIRGEELAFMEIPLVFTAAKKLQEIREAPATVEVVTSREIRRWGARTLQEVLRRLPGVTVRNYGIVYEVYLRGINGKDRVLCLVDGRRVNSAFDGSFRGDLPLTNVERIEIVRGPGSALYGPNAFGGVINIITRTGGDLEGAEATLGVGTDGTVLHSLAGGAASDGFDGFASRGHLRTDGQGILNGNDWYQADDLFAKVSFDGFTISGGRQEFNQGIQGRLGRESPTDRLDDTCSSVDAAYSHRRDPLAVTVRAFRDVRTNDYTFSGRPMDFRGTLQGGEAQFSWTADGRTTVIAGLDIKWDEAGLADRLFEDRNTGAYLEYETRPLERLLITLGGRYDNHSQYEDVFSPRASAVWLPDGSSSFRLSYGEAFRAPSIQDLYVDFHLSPTMRMVGNPDLQPETLRTLELAALHRRGEGLDLSLTAFLTRAEDLIQIQSSFSRGVVINSARNVGEARIAGLEAGIRGNPTDWLGFFLNYSYQDAEDGAGTRLLYLPFHQVSGGVTLLPRAGVSLSLLARHTGARPGMDNDRHLTVEMASYTVLDLTLNGRWRGLTSQATVQNLLNRDYQETPGYPMPRRSFLLSVGCSF